MIRSILFIPVLYVLMSLPLSAQWVVKHVDVHGPIIHDLHVLPDGTGLAVGTGGFILRTDDFGESWTPVPASINEDLYQIALFSIDTIVVRGQDKQNNGTLYRSFDGGFTWEKVYTHTNELFSLQFFNDSVGLASGTNTIIRTTDRGKTWSIIYDVPASTSFKTSIIWMDIATDSIAYAGILAWESGLKNMSRFLLKSSDEGKTWEQIYEFDDTSINCEVYFLNEFQGFMVENYLLRTMDGGMTWDTTDNIGDIVDVSMPGNSCVYTINNLIPVGEAPSEFAICSSMDTGKSWQGKFQPGANLGSIHFMNDTVGFVAGWHSIIMKTEHGGGPIVGDYPWDLYTSLTDEAGTPIGITLYPNPARSVLHLHVDEPSLQGSEIQVNILQSDGVVQLSMPFALSNQTMDIPVSSLTSGVYFLQITDSAGQVLSVEKVVIE